MENLGFFDAGRATPTWSDAPIRRRGRHERLAGGVPASPTTPKPDPLADWQPTEVGTRLLRGNVRWSLVAGVALLVAGLVVLAYWAYQRPIAASAEALVRLETTAGEMPQHLAELAAISESLTGSSQQESPTQVLLSAQAAARRLFDASGDLPASEMGTRSLAADAASQILDASGLLADAHAFRAAIVPVLVPPAFETDPGLIELDDAARQFGEWQLRFDRVRSALPDGSLSSFAVELELFSGDLEAIQGRYVDALREDDEDGARRVIGEIAQSLRSLAESLDAELAAIQIRVEDRIAEADSALAALLG